MLVKASDLIGPALDWAVARAAGLYAPEPWISTPSTNWSIAGPIIDREGIMFQSGGEGVIIAYLRSAGTSGVTGQGATHLQAAMRAYVASRLGDEVEVPDELTEGTHE